MSYSGVELGRNSFTDEAPSFPYKSSEARQQLGIPDSPEIHLAITALAERLLLTLRDLTCEPRTKRIVALTCASYAVLFRHPLEHAELDVLQRLGVEIEQEAWTRISHLKQTDWLGKAVEKLCQEGVAIDPGFRRQATRYGWTSLE